MNLRRRKHIPCLAEVRSSRGWAVMCALRNGHDGCHENADLRWFDPAERRFR